MSGVVSQKAINMIVELETGGRSYYNKVLSKPTWPGGASGVTIGVGYDLGYHTQDAFRKDWGSILSSNDISLLVRACGIKGDTARRFLIANKSLKNISISYDNAMSVFSNSQLPKWISNTLKAFPGSQKLNPDGFGALVSLVLNRGASMTGDTRKEMRDVRDCIARNNVSCAASAIRRMKRLWVGKNLNGLLIRRDREAQLLESSASTNSKSFDNNTKQGFISNIISKLSGFLKKIIK